jgi:hypothetical protein
MRFSIPLITFDSFCLLLRHKMSSLLNATLHVEPLAGLHVQLAGLPVLRSLLHRLKPTAALRHFDTEVHRHILDLSETQSITLRHERAQPLNLEMPPEYGLPPTPVMWSYIPGHLRSQLPQPHLSSHFRHR